MKFIDIEEIWKKYPNKYQAIILAAKEVRKMTEAKKASTSVADATQSGIEPSKDASALSTAVPDIEPSVIELSQPKKRGRKPKKTITEKPVTSQKTETPEDISVTFETITDESEPTGDTAQRRSSVIGIRKVVAEKMDENPYRAALKKILK